MAQPKLALVHPNDALARHALATPPVPSAAPAFRASSAQDCTDERRYPSFWLNMTPFRPKSERRRRMAKPFCCALDANSRKESKICAEIESFCDDLGFNCIITDLSCGDVSLEWRIRPGWRDPGERSCAIFSYSLRKIPGLPHSGPILVQDGAFQGDEAGRRGRKAKTLCPEPPSRTVGGRLGERGWGVRAYLLLAGSIDATLMFLPSSSPVTFTSWPRFALATSCLSRL